jgi:hypothetical protein
LIVLSLFCGWQVYGDQSTFTAVDGVYLYNADGTTQMSTNNLVLLVAVTGSATPTNLILQPTAQLGAVGTVLQNNNVILGKWTLDSGNGNGFFQQPCTVTIQTNKTVSQVALPGVVQTGDPVVLYWFPTLTLSATTVSSGTAYGMYTTNAVLDVTDTPDGWFVQPAMANNTIGMLTVASGAGSLPESTGKASYVTVPEPSAFLLVAMGLGLGITVLRRRK